MPVVVKICGVTSVVDAQACLAAGADWVGLNLVGGPRLLAPAAVKAIASQLHDPSSIVVLTEILAGDLQPEAAALLQETGISRLQLYGSVTPRVVEMLEGKGIETIVVLHVGSDSGIDEAEAFLDSCGVCRPSFVLFDAATRDALGGTGRRADWRVIRRARESGRLDGWPRQILAGGLSPECVTQGIEEVAPWGVDVSSGVESSPGIKDARQVEAFVANAKASP